MSAVTAYVAVGANLGDRQANIRSAVAALDDIPDVHVVRTSSLIENPAVGGPPNSPSFLNGVVAVQTTLSPQTLLQELLKIERSLGRERREKWEPRSIDLDLVLYGDKVVQTAELTVPHPLMHERPFVLEPLVEIAPDVVHPVLRKTVKSLLAALS
jgi:2-amino-4-hydroxy-6-hydroxymethyldihydropteridine diphosphokinase